MFLENRRIKNIRTGVKGFMQSLMEQNNLKLVKKTENNDLSTEGVNYLLNIAQNSEPKIKNEIENRIVNMGSKAIPELINCIQHCKGASRGVAAMSLIRIGLASIPFLNAAAEENTEFKWVADYLIREIEGSKQSLAC